jgi:hypothetical protein
MDAGELIDNYCAVWSEPDAAARARMLDAVWSQGASYTDPTVIAESEQALLAHIAGVHERRPGAKVERTSAVDLHHGLARFAWRALGADGAVLREGIDVAFISGDGCRIERIIGFFGPLWHDAA